ncbi:MAG: hypothetical protein ACXWKP_21600 [Bradyrhizobium sp.]
MLEINGRQHYPPKLLPSRTALVRLPTFDNLVFCDSASPTIFGGMQYVNSGYGLLVALPGNALPAFSVTDD